MRIVIENVDKDTKQLLIDAVQAKFVQSFRNVMLSDQFLTDFSNPDCYNEIDFPADDEIAGKYYPDETRFLVERVMNEFMTKSDEEQEVYEKLLKLLKSAKVEQVAKPAKRERTK